ncbi:hypothetical protein PHYPSEUDO_003744 [Phytophthora pseudosyringae]|uniref:Uncharacterized protein n=1 Tax=Phytophthora pseudosyringae TaxID=221518 RepID=A0A8T1VV25_9STRA|nr:hypothetical protein PHYPSEUDO_003744 [Phytophthora pseudosyringae]
MALTVTLSDVELQLSRVTGVVRLHARLTEASLKAEDVWGRIGNRGDVLTFVGNVERAQSEVHCATQQLLDLIKRSLNGDLVGTEVGHIDDSETEDELEHCGLEPPISIKLEKAEYNAETLDESTGVTTQMNQDADRDVEAKKELVDDMGFNALTNCGGKENEMARMNTGDEETKKTIVDVDDRGIVSWTQTVENNAIAAERRLLEQFGFGHVEGGSAAEVENMKGISTSHIDSVSPKDDGLFVQSNLYFPPIKTKRSRRTRRSGKRKCTTSVDTNHSAETENGILDRVSAVSEASVDTGCVNIESKSSGGNVTLASDRDSSHKERDGQFLEVTSHFNYFLTLPKRQNNQLKL